VNTGSRTALLMLRAHFDQQSSLTSMVYQVYKYHCRKDKTDLRLFYVDKK